MTRQRDGETEPTSAWSPWRTVVGFGLVSLAGDMVYEGARSVYGPLLAALGASATMVGLVTGAGEATALLLRLVSGPFADRSRRYWTLTMAGYALTAVCVPLLAITPTLGAAGLAVATGLILAERLGKAIRSPAKSALLADAAGHVGMGRGLGVHKALDQIGALAGPLLVAAIVVAAAGRVWPALAVLAVPGAASIVILLVVRARGGNELEPPAVAAATADSAVALPARFWWFAVATGLCTAGLVTYGLIGYHLVRDHLVGTAAVPLLYAAAMAAAAVAALITGLVYDRSGPWVLLVLPVLVAGVPALAFGTGMVAVVPGILLWGAATGVQDSTVKALVADLVPRHRRATRLRLVRRRPRCWSVGRWRRYRGVVSALPDQSDHRGSGQPGRRLAPPAQALRQARCRRTTVMQSAVSPPGPPGQECWCALAPSRGGRAGRGWCARRGTTPHDVCDVAHR